MDEHSKGVAFTLLWNLASDHALLSLRHIREISTKSPFCPCLSTALFLYLSYFGIRIHNS